MESCRSWGCYCDDTLEAKDELRVHRSIHTTVALGIISGLLLSVVGVIFAPKILVLMGTPKDCFTKFNYLF